MSDYNQNNRSGGGRGGSRFGGRDSGGRGYWGRDATRTLFKATCAECGNACEVPFRPSGNRPIYCSNCFEKMGKGESDLRRTDRRNFGRPRFEERRPYSEAGGDSRRANALVLEQLKSLSVKLDKIMSVLETSAVKTPAPKKKVAESKAAES